MPPLSVLMEMAFLLQISASPIEVNFNADMNEKPENIYSIYYPTITTRWVISIIFTHSEWVILSKTTHSEWAFLEKRLLFTFYLASTEPHFLRLLRSEGVIDCLSLITYLPLRIGNGEMNGNNVVTYMMQGSYYKDARKQLYRCKKAIISIAWHLSCDYTTLIIWSDDKCRIITWHIPMFK